MVNHFGNCIMRITVLFLLFFSNIMAQTKSMLWLGNSYVAVNNLPDLLYQLALSGGDTIQYDAYTPGGYTLQLHWDDAFTQSKITQQDWDYVIIQAQSQEPSLDSFYVSYNVYPYAAALDSVIHVNDTCTQTVFYMTWGRKNGDAQNCASYPAVCTYEGMQDQLTHRYLHMAHDNGAMVSPCGEAWRTVIASNPSFDLYSADESHPSLYGSYLNACVFYASIYRRSPYGLPYYAGLPIADAQFLQQVAGNCVLDSMPLWNTEVYYDDPAFTSTWLGGNTWQFDAAVTGSNHQWNSGSGYANGNASVVYTFPGNGVYTICHVTDNGCLTDTMCQMITVGPQNVDDPSVNDNVAVMVHPEGEIEVNVASPQMDFYLLDMTGRTVMEGVLVQGANTIHAEWLSGGTYTLVVRDPDSISTHKILIAGSQN